MAILQAGQQSPSSMNGQQISLVVTHDKERLKKIASIAGNQSHIALADLFITLVVDFHRTAVATAQQGQHQVIEQSAEGVIAGALDAGIMLNALQTAANSLGYGSTAVGGIRNDPDAMIRLLNLPEKTFPILGMTLGVPDKNHPSTVKPRIPMACFAMCERYDCDVVRQGVEEYDQTLKKWWQQQGEPDQPSYKEALANAYSQFSYPHVASSMKKQGFGFNDKEIVS